MEKRLVVTTWMAMLLLQVLLPVPGVCDPLRTLTDSLGNTVTLPTTIERAIGSGSGCLRLITYLGAQDRIVAVDDIETRNNRFDARPYALVNPRFKTLPVFGEFRGHDHPERIVGLSPLPQVILKTFGNMGMNPSELRQKTGIPVVTMTYGDLGGQRQTFFKTLEIAGRTLNKEARARAIITFFKSQIAELEKRTAGVAGPPTCFVGGIAYKGPHGFQSTEPGYPPFQFVNAVNVAATPGNLGGRMTRSTISKEKLMAWDPAVLFLDLSTLQMGDAGGGLAELRTDPAFQSLTAVKQGRIFGVLPYNWYSQNFGSILANAWFIGKVLYPDRFTDIDPARKADEIYTFLVNRPVFDTMDARFGNLAFKRIDLNQGEKG
ncbi:MAG: ABC transporter substrate-binding protein [Desulfobacteraceae bacterium]|nr:ABC transporter substrate-binding protein [Desulfobacteraceae bacterium]